ncbi:hypothetical protein D3C87_2119380 [compost metagenome]
MLGVVAGDTDRAQLIGAAATGTFHRGIPTLNRNLRAIIGAARQQRHAELGAADALRYNLAPFVPTFREVRP